MSMDDERFYTELCKECGGFKMKCDLYGCVPKNPSSKSDKPYEESGSTNALAALFLISLNEYERWGTPAHRRRLDEARISLQERLRQEGWYKD
jgi:hypothetical protein